MSARPSARLALGAVAGGLLLVGIALGDDLRARVEGLVRRTQYDLALGLLEDRAAHEALPRDLVWMRARLLPDPDAFFDSARRVREDKDPADTLAHSVAVAVAREHFARGEYLAALQDLDDLPPTELAARPAALVVKGMAAGALGRMMVARETLAQIQREDSAFATAQVLLAGLSLRTGENGQALDYADAALASDAHRVGAQALYARSTALDALGRASDATATQQRLVREFPGSSEAAWVQESQTAPGPPAAAVRPGVPEVETPPSRVDFALQLGAFHDRALALRLASRLAGQLLELRIEHDGSAAPPWYRVVGGRFATRRLAEETLGRLKAAGVSGIVLAPGQDAP